MTNGAVSTSGLDGYTWKYKSLSCRRVPLPIGEAENGWPLLPLSHKPTKRCPKKTHQYQAKADRGATAAPSFIVTERAIPAGIAWATARGKQRPHMYPTGDLKMRATEEFPASKTCALWQGKILQITCLTLGYRSSS